MAQSFPKTLVLDIGRSWTKAFIVENDKNKLIIDKRSSLPTTTGDISFAVNQLFAKLKVTKELPILVTGSIPEAETLAKNLNVDFVNQEENQANFKNYCEKNGFKNPIIFDAGNYIFSPNTKINHIGAFLTHETSDIDIENYFGNKSTKPQVIPINLNEMEIEEAFYRVAFSQNRDFVNAHGTLNIVVTGAFFSFAPKQSKLALIILDILASNRVAQIKLDRELFLHSFGALLKKYPEIADWENDFLLDLGAAISMGGKGTVLLDYGFSENQELSINEDEIALVPAPSKQKIEATFSQNKEKTKVKLNGGAFGLLIDGRIKPLKLAFGRAESREDNKRWQEAIEKVEMIE